MAKYALKFESYAHVERVLTELNDIANVGTMEGPKPFYAKNEREKEADNILYWLRMPKKAAFATEYWPVHTDQRARAQKEAGDWVRRGLGVEDLNDMPAIIAAMTHRLIESRRLCTSTRRPAYAELRRVVKETATGLERLKPYTTQSGVAL
jgi:hypothetical protein